jgi:hypothetical protein
MAGQGLERREVLRVLALAAGASGFPGFARWTFACGHAAPGPLQIRPAVYTPRFFSDEGPGAHEAGVAEFIDFMVSSDPGVQYRFRYGITWLEAHAGKLHGRRFTELAAAEQAALLGPLAYRDRERAGEEEGRAFFKLVREYTVMGFYTSKAGLQQLDYPGLKTYYPASPGCPHPDDPEHRRL